MTIQTTPTGLTIVLEENNGKYELKFVRNGVSIMIILSDVDLKYLSLVTSSEDEV